jgi:hypothetical protein
MTLLRFPLAVVAALVVCAPAPAADPLPPADKAIPEVVDHYLDAELKKAGVTPARPASNATLVRRLTLDLAGRVPTLAETRAFVESKDKDKTARLVDRLMASPAFVRHQATEFDTLLMDGTRGSVRGYLLTAFKENRPWDRIFRELLLPDQKDPKQKGAAEFLKQRLRDLDLVTSDVSSVFFGVNVSCARCHDHPLALDWKMDHYYGMKSFFIRTYNAGGFVAERDFGSIKFKNSKGQDTVAKVMFLNGKVAEVPPSRQPTPAEMKKLRGKFKKRGQMRTPPPPPKFSVRAQLVKLALEPGKADFFARAIVNRVWHWLFGQGLVMPLDQMHSANPPSHPELLQWLGRDLEAHKYDLRRLIRGLVLSRAYARSSRWEGSKTPDPQLFAVANLRPLTPMQLATSLYLVTTDPARFPAGMKADAFDKQVEGLENRGRGFAGNIEQPRGNFQIGVGEALLFSNNERVQQEFLADGRDRLVGRLVQVKDRKELIDLAVRTVLARPPRAEENKVLSEYLGKRQDRPVEACRQVVWALLTGPEFRFNH